MDALWLDPVTAPNIPIKVDLSFDREVVDRDNFESGIVENRFTGRFWVKIVIRSWDRQSDMIRESTVDADNRDKLEMVTRVMSPSDEDLTWLANIGARDG